MRCTSLQSELPDYLAGALGDEAAREVEAHLAQCADCSARVDELRPLFTILSVEKRAPRPMFTDASFIVAVNARIDAPRARAWRPGPLFTRLALPGIAAACLLVGIILFGPNIPPSDDTLVSTHEISTILGSLDETQRDSLRGELVAANAADGGATTTLPAVSDAALEGLDVTGVLFSDVAYPELVRAGSAYLDDETLFELLPADAIDSAAPSVPAQ
ncbi:MAG: zf-HC2 domain-containing protein [Ignavibacteriae bacterium]|nr:zf-HC2 domain-containing protein [Ignavibacteriota bacterium]